MSDDDKSKDDLTSDDTDKDDASDHKAEAEKWKAMARKHEAQAKANADAARKLAELEDKDKSESQRLADTATLAQKEAAEAKRETARLRVAMRKGLTETQAKRLVGETEEDLEADADELLESFGGKGDKGSDDDKDKGDKPLSGRPKERMRAGAAPDDEPDETDPRKLAAAVPRL